MSRDQEQIIALLAPLEHLETLSYNDVRYLQDAVTTYFNSVDNNSLCNCFDEGECCNIENLPNEELYSYYVDDEIYNPMYWQDAHQCNNNDVDDSNNDDDDDVFNQFYKEFMRGNQYLKKKRIAKGKLEHLKEKDRNEANKSNSSCAKSNKELQLEKQKEPQQELCSSNNKVINKIKEERHTSKSPSPHAPNSTLPTCRSLFTSESTIRSASNHENMKITLNTSKEPCEELESIKHNVFDVLLPAREVEEFDIGRKLREDAKCKYYEARDKKKIMNSSVVTLKVYTNGVNLVRNSIKDAHNNNNNNFKITNNTTCKYYSCKTEENKEEKEKNDEQWVQEIYNEVKWQELVASKHSQHVLRLFGYYWIDSMYHAPQLAIVQEASHAQSLYEVLHKRCASVSNEHMNIGFVQSVLVQLLHVLVSLHAENIAFGGIHPRHILLHTNNTTLNTTNNKRQELTSAFTLADGSNICPSNKRNKNKLKREEEYARTLNINNVINKCNVNGAEGTTIKLTDFTQTHECTTESETVEETNIDLNYTAPEMLNLIWNHKNSKKCKKSFTYTCKRGNMASDMWALGVLCYQMLLNDLPFDDVDETKMVKLILGGIVFFPRSVPGQAKDFMQRLLTVETDKRVSARDALAHPFLQVTNSNYNGNISSNSYSNCTQTGMVSDNYSVHNSYNNTTYISNSNNNNNNNNSSYSNTKTNSNSICSDSCPVNTMSFAKILSHPSGKKTNEADNFLYCFDSANNDDEKQEHLEQQEINSSKHRDITFNASSTTKGDCSYDSSYNKSRKRKIHMNSSTVSLPQSPSTALSLSEISVSSLSVTCKPFPELTPLAHTKRNTLTSTSEEHKIKDNNCESSQRIGDSGSNENKNENRSANAIVATDTLQVSSTSCSNSSSIITSLLTSLSEEMESNNKLISATNQSTKHDDVSANVGKIEAAKDEVARGDRDKDKVDANYPVISTKTNERYAKSTSPPSSLHSMTSNQLKKKERRASSSPSPEPRSSLGLSCTDSDKRSVSS